MSRKKKFKRVLLCALLISLPLFSMTNILKHDILENEKVEMCYINDTVNDSIQQIEMQRLYIQQQKDSIKDVLIKEVEKYIFKIAPKVHKDIPVYLVEHALNYNIDLAFMMAQTQIETSFGTAGAGRESSRRSLFGVAVRKYLDYNLAIDDYCKILKESYLVKGRTEQHLMKRYVTGSGYRYAGNPKYEAELRKTYNVIANNTNIRDLQSKYNL